MQIELCDQLNDIKLASSGSDGATSFPCRRQMCPQTLQLLNPPLCSSAVTIGLIQSVQGKELRYEAHGGHLIILTA